MGFITVVGGPHFLCFLMPLIIWRLGQNYTITQKSGVSVIVSSFAWKYGVSPVCRKMLLKFGDIVILMNILSIGKQTGYARSKGKRIPCFFVAPYVRPPLFVSLNHTIFNEDIFRRVWWNHLTCHYIAVTLHFAVGLHRWIFRAEGATDIHLRSASQMKGSGL